MVEHFFIKGRHGCLIQGDLVGNATVESKGSQSLIIVHRSLNIESDGGTEASRAAILLGTDTINERLHGFVLL